MSEPKMYYFGVWWNDSSGHFLVDENGHNVRKEHRGTFPWNEWSGDIDAAAPTIRSTQWTNNNQVSEPDALAGSIGVAN